MSTRDGHADADIRINIRIIRINRAISDTCRIMRIYPHRCASANISAWPSLMSTRQLESGVLDFLLIVLKNICFVKLLVEDRAVTAYMRNVIAGTPLSNFVLCLHFT